MKIYSAEEIYGCFLLFPKISTDSRRIEKDCLFFALKGDNFNGNEFADKAIENGAAYSIIDDEAFLVNDNCLLVENVLECLQQIAVIHRMNLQIPVLGITGSNGKTTTKELISAVLATSYNIVATQGNLNNHIGVPLTILKITADTEIAIIEMGANHQGEIAFLCKIAMPDFGIITNIGKAHLGEFGGFEGVKKAKNELYKHIEQTGGTIFVNSNDLLLMQLSANINRIGYGSIVEGTNVNVTGMVKHSNPMLTVAINGEKETNLATQLVGEYNFPNILAAISIGRFFGVTESNIFKAIEEYTPTNNRSQWVNTGKNQLILDAYNANPSSMEAALINFSKVDTKTKVVILGGMKELGDESPQEHLKIFELTLSLKFDRIILVGLEFQKVPQNNLSQCFNDVDELIGYISANPVTGSNILIKGSRSIKLEKIVDLL